MIYHVPNSNDPIRQGDIYIGLPRVEFSLEKVLLVQDTGPVQVSWGECANSKDVITALVPVRPVSAIVITQDCDAVRGADITLCEVRDFRDVERKSQNTKSPKSWKDLITQQARLNQKWFYLPPAPSLGWTEKQAADFRVTLRLPRVDLEAHSSLRRARLNDLAEKHFRERLSEFFRRYPYDEWYPLDPQELAAYVKEYPETVPYPWQAATSEPTQADVDSSLPEQSLIKENKSR